MDWPSVAAKLIDELLPRLSEGVLNAAVVVVVSAGGGAVLFRLWQRIAPIGERRDRRAVDRELAVLTHRLEQMEASLAKQGHTITSIDVRVAELHGLIVANLTARVD